MLTHPETTQAFGEGAVRFRAQLAGALPAPDADVRAALISAIIMGVVMDRHLLKSGGLDAADPEQIVALLRPVLRTLTAADAPPGPP
jgi:hypothetical protein